jgi:DNA polymerase-3 subunit epsilon
LKARASIPLAEVRWVAIDCETSGLDPKRDRLLSVGAVAVEGGRVRLAEAYGAILAQAQPSSPDNIAVHGIGGEAQRAGRPSAEVLRELAAFLGDGVPVAFHASFDAEVLKRALKAAELRPLPRPWVDLAQVAPALYRDQKQQALEDWLARFQIAPHGRHDAVGDALATAQLLLVLLEEAARQGIRTLADLEGAAGSRRWLAG